MSQSLRVNEVAMFNARVHQAYAATGILRDTIRVVTSINAATYQFQKIGDGIMIPRIPQTEVLPANILNTNVVATLLDFYIAEFTDKFDQQKVNYSERMALAETFGRSGGRRVDQQIIDAAENASTALTVPNTIGATTGMNTAKFRETKQLLDTGNVPEEGRTFVMSTVGHQQILGDSDADTVDKNVVKPLVDGDLKHWLGFDIEKIGNRDEGGLPLTAGDRTSFAYHKSAIGLAVGQDPTTMIDWIPQFTSWLVQSHYIGGAIAIDVNGIVEIDTEE